MSIRVKILVLAGLAGVYANAQSTQAPNVYNVLSWSSVFNQNVLDSSGNKIGVLSNAVPNVFGFSSNASLSLANVGATLPMSNMQIDTQIIKVNNAINTSIATALGVIPIASPASGVIFRTDPVTGVDLPASSTLGPVFTERAETIGKHKWYIGVTHEDFHFTSLNGQSLNGLRVLDTGGVKSGITNLAGQNLASTGNLLSYPATFDIGLDVRLSQDVAFITYGVTDRFDVSLGLPVVHAAVSARTWNGILYTGDGGAGQTGPTAQNPNCWCAGTFNPGAFVSPTTNFTLPQIGQTSLGKTGFGDLLVRAKGTVVDTGRVVVALGADVRFQTGDAANYLGTGTTSVKPFAAMSLYTHSLPHGIVFAPHFNVGWQFSGKSILGGQLQPNPLSATTTNGTVQYDGAPLISSKDYLPDVFSWAVGSEVALGRHNTIVIDILGNQIGWIHGAPNLVMGSAQGFSPTTLQPVTATGLMGSGTTSYSQYSGAFGYKARLVGNLVFTFNALVRFDNNGLTARFTPLYGLGYSF